MGMTDMPTRAAVLDFLERHPDKTHKGDIARGLGLKGEARAELRRILAELEAEGALTRTGKRAFAPSEAPPPTGVVRFERVDAMGDLVGRAMGRDGPFGPEILYAGPLGRGRQLTLGPGDRALCRVLRGADDIWRAKAIRKLEAVGTTSTIGVYRANRYGGQVQPTSRKDRHDYIVENQDSKGAGEGDLVRIAPKQGKGYGPRRAEVLEIVGREDDPRAASLIAMHAHGVPDEFPSVVLEEAETARPAKCPREDLTRIPLITIDPDDARDHDDAVFAEPLPGGGWRAIVAIADVAAYVHPGSALDREAYRRGNSTYFPDRVSPMLPEGLSADACSLREGELRETFAVEIRIGADGAKHGHRFFRGRMRSAGKLSYREAQDAIDGKPNDRTGPLLEPVLQPLWDCWRALDAARKKRDPLDLDLPERRVRIGEDGQVASITLRERFDAHRLIEEFMIQANVCAAETLEARRSPLVYRVHEEPSEQKIAALAGFLPTVGLRWTKGEKTSTSRLNRLLALARDSENQHMINEMVLRSQAQARYADENLGHFGLNLARYAHFTSPIRRYSDLIVHRALIRALDLGPDGSSGEELSRLEEMAEHLTMTERRSMAAEREATDRYLAHFMSTRIGDEFAGRIAGVAGAGLFVRLDETGADGFVPAARISDDFWVYDEVSAALVARRSGERYELGMPVEVRLVEATPLTGGLMFAILTDPRPPRHDLALPDAWRSTRPGRPQGQRPFRPGAGPRSGKGGKRRR